MPRQTRFRSYQKCCRGAGGRRKALLLACRRRPAPFPLIFGPAQPGTAPGSKFGSCGTLTMLCFPAPPNLVSQLSEVLPGAITVSRQPVTTPQAGGSGFGSCKTRFSRA
ncbi:hypothetical protein [uncultured Corynebacterium sp.]|uniref:hypothetical protein n=1 Tax=uncultured Corynebacterium sp. TaxID=159447 RepID=UPI0028E8AAE3|nr:hypothetical protein [uncultured Corynebacterium sp.]